MKEKIIIAGSGGHGVLTLGIFLSRTGIFEGKNVTWLPSYGAEKRGGFSFCNVVISDSEIFSPIVETPDVMILFDQRAMDIYGPKSGKRTDIIINSSYVKEDKTAEFNKKVLIPASEIAGSMGFLKAMNTVFAGSYNALREIFKTESCIAIIQDSLKGKSDKVIQMNLNAFNEGMKYKK